MTEDMALRQNRLALLAKLQKLFMHVADISVLVPAKYWAYTVCSLVNLLLTTLRTTVFYAGFVVLTVTASTVTCLLFFLPFRLLQRIATVGNLLVMQWLRVAIASQVNYPQWLCVVAV